MRAMMDSHTATLDLIHILTDIQDCMRACGVVSYFIAFSLETFYMVL